MTTTKDMERCVNIGLQPPPGRRHRDHHQRRAQVLQTPRRPTAAIPTQTTTNQDKDLDMPQRVRAPGWRKPEGAISVARPHKWGNPFVVGENGIRTNASAVELYRMWLPGQDIYHQLPELTGHDLMCHCPPDQPCYADVLLALANP
jgi:Domain of unknown function (DUF4326)